MRNRSDRTNEFNAQNKQIQRNCRKHGVSVCFLNVPSVWRTKIRWQRRKSPVAPECCPVGSSPSSYSRYASCPHWTDTQINHQLFSPDISFQLRGQMLWGYAMMITTVTINSTVINSHHQKTQRAGRRNDGASPELFLITHELDQSFLIWLTPLQLQWGTVHNFWLHEQTPGLFVQPVLWSRVLLH